ncbi:hypothetical protein MIND_00696200 [Mycena indigotica]|uniref:Glycoside hydrolase family 71 protein n=1 Tax=Mycena indigotica TaxID=2126181 RepID=A0A8H6SKY4_9AGAR|nr:uncharacterized protein MIND_00696200 [Mycena indigotica]KAF7301311.1 hypothetical protein MIND_00696200 [Mycena indigotica]
MKCLLLFLLLGPFLAIVGAQQAPFLGNSPPNQSQSRSSQPAPSQSSQSPSQSSQPAFQSSQSPSRSSQLQSQSSQSPSQSNQLPSQSSQPQPQSSSQPSKYVVAHFMVGNTYPYTTSDWVQDIAAAASRGIDGFALNVGGDPWQPARLAAAYDAAKRFAPSINFKLFISLDMTSIPCATTNHANQLRNFYEPFRNHPNQLNYNGRPLLSTFSGEWCRFGMGNLNDAWNYVLKSNGALPVHFVASFFVDPANFRGMSFLDGAFNLNGRTYMAAVSPWFFTHYGTDSWNKNWIYRCDDFHFAQRWELIVQNRNLTAIAQVISWNDYGESHYVGPIHGAQPNSQAWVNGFDHQGWLDLQTYYITAFKTGQYPPITRDRVFLWARLYPANANAQDRVGRPDNWQWTKDILWGVAMLTAPAQLTATCGSSRLSTTLPAGLSKFQLPLVSTCNVVVTLARSNSVFINFAPSGFTFRTDPPSYNFNAFVAAS